jgi:hypothetical protein
MAGNMTIKKVQEVFNKYIRYRDAGSGECKCISCDSIVQLKGCHASHYFSAGHYKSLRFNEDNCHVSCIKCNTFLHGNLIQYRKGLIEKIGQERYDKLEFLAAAGKRSTWKPMAFELQIIHDEFKAKLKALKNEN